MESLLLNPHVHAVFIYADYFHERLEILLPL